MKIVRLNGVVEATSKVNLDPRQSYQPSHYGSTNHPKHHLDRLALHFNICKQHQWHPLTQSVFFNSNAKSIVQSHHGVLEMLKRVYPELRWGKCRTVWNHWKELTNQRLFIEEVMVNEGVSKALEVKTLTTRRLFEVGGKAVYYYYESIGDMMSAIYPAFKLGLPSQQQGRWLLERIGGFLGAMSVKDWVWMDFEEVKMEFEIEKPLLLKLLMNYTEFNWGVFERVQMSDLYYQRRENQRLFFDEVYMGIRRVDELKVMTQLAVSEVGGRFIFTGRKGNYNMLFVLMLVGHYPEFNRMSFYLDHQQDFHCSLVNQRWSVEHSWCSSPLKTIKDWKKIVLNHKLMAMYSSNLLSLFNRLFPEFNWNLLSLGVSPRNLWLNEDYQLFLLELLRNDYQLRSKQDWYRLSHQQTRQTLGKFMSKKKLHGMLKSNFPEEEWSLTVLSMRNKKSRQRWLIKLLGSLYPDSQIIENYRLKRTNRIPCELDVFIPEKQVAVEFHGEQHFMELPQTGFASLFSRRTSDEEKEKLCSDMGIKLLVVPYWWDNQMESLLMHLQQ